MIFFRRSTPDKMKTLVLLSVMASGSASLAFGQSSEAPPSQQPKPAAEAAKPPAATDPPPESKPVGAAPVDPRSYMIGNEDVIAIGCGATRS
jgi:hypothetical protein